MTSNEIRNQFLDFFKEKEHRIIDSAPVVPFDDPTLLFTNAGMNQFKDVFLGEGSRDYNRATDTQKCIRVSGKHNDLEEVGRDTYHHTFFEMLGNWSLGNPLKPEEGYYKEEAITWAWELLTEVWKLPKERLWATVYRTDDESMEIWKSKTDINPEHVLKFDEKDNFWEMGETGPCGPCSEIHINVSDDIENPKLVNAGVEECIEIWNLVFVQYNRDKNGTLNDLPAKHVDTGMGFERIVAVLQDKKSNYDTDVFMPIISKIKSITAIDNPTKEESVSIQVIADHIRTLTFAIADGATPGNEGRGYVLRRILRRAARFGRVLNLNKPFMYSLVDVLTETMGDVFPEIVKNKENVVKIITAEEKSFNRTLDRGIELFESIAAKSDKIIKGEDVFKLYDTFGFPVDLTNVMAEEKGLTIDELRFNELMDEQKERARNSTKGNIISMDLTLTAQLTAGFEIIKKTEFTGYDYRFGKLNNFRGRSTIIDSKNINEQTILVLDKTPFYVESGGQVSDTGDIIFNRKHFRVLELVKKENQIFHIINNPNGISFNEGDKVMPNVDGVKRWDIMRNHSATHLMHTALRTVLGGHVKQSGSFVDNEKLRFDFTHFEKVTNEEIKSIEIIVNDKIREGLKFTEELENTPFEKAKEMGALMFFGDKYGDKVNVVQFGDYSTEFCGGTHVKNTSQIGIFKIESESSIGSGVRRIEAVTCNGVVGFIEKLEKKKSELDLEIKEFKNDINCLYRDISNLNPQNRFSDVDSTKLDVIPKQGIEVESFINCNITDNNIVVEFISEQEINISNLSDQLVVLKNNKRKLEKDISVLELQSKLGGIDEIVKTPIDINGVNLFKGKVEASSMDELKSMGDELRNKMKSGVGVLISAIGEKVGIVCVVSDDLIKEKKIQAGKIVGSVAKIVGGGGGGRPHLATAGGKDISKIDKALENTNEIVRGMT